MLPRVLVVMNYIEPDQLQFCRPSRDHYCDHWTVAELPVVGV